MLINITSEKFSAFALSKSVFKLQLLYMDFKFSVLNNKDFDNFRVLALCLKLRVDRDLFKFLIAFITVRI